MLNQLVNYRKEIALNLMALMLGSVLLPYKGQAATYNESNRNYYASGSSHVSANKKLVLNHTKRLDLPASATSLKTAKRKYNGGPGQPEMSGFKSVNADNMVDLFSGDFSYNIPLLDVGGYPVNLFYNGGITMDQPASWVGLGFNINPGTIMRNMRGLPDDFDGTDTVTKTQTMRPDRTWGVNASAGAEILGFKPLNLNATAGVSFNNQRGIALEYGIHPSISISAKAGNEKTASLSFGANLKVNSQSGASFTPSIGLSLNEAEAMGGSLTASLGYHSRMGLQSLHLDGELSKSKTIDAIQYNGTLYSHSSAITFAYPSVMPSMRTILTRKNFNVNLKFGTEAFTVHPHAGLGGFYSETRIAEDDKVSRHAAYGMLYYQRANDNKKAMLDFNRLNDGVFTKNSPTIALPVYTYDVFSISGEGTGGSFRAYRGDLGYVRDELTKTRDDAGTLGVELGTGNLVHSGVNAEYVYSPTTVGSWENNNLAKDKLRFKKSEGLYQAVYFKNPGEKAIPDIAFQNAIGGEDLVRLKLINQSSGTPMVLPTIEKFNDSKYKTGDLAINATDVTKKRDKRTQIITTLTAEEAERVGFDKTINSYDPLATGVVFGRCDGTGIKKIKRFTGTRNYSGNDNYRKQNHISEIDVMGEDGRRYVYGIPVYNIKEADVTFNVDNGNSTTQQSSYTPGTDDSKSNQKGKDWYMEKQEMPAYTHSFLLTALLSPNYVDVKGDGITEDDMGDAIKFNYSQFEQGIKWRTPSGQNSATWNEGMKTDNKDDKAHYIYGEREMWYLYSIESKNMVARFYVVNDRKDERQAQGPAGGTDNNWGAQRLSKISLFSKGDLVKYGAGAKPVKTVNFEYSYKLCKGVPGSTGGVGENGKLTLESIYFTYNGNEKQRKNRYKFSYAQNPDYDYNANDRWGNYKVRTDNPDNLANSDYPYVVQDKTKADQYSAAWMLSQITLPSGGKMDIEYESDDYAFVQDRRASSMYRVIGFGNTESPSAAQQTGAALYTKSEEYDYVYAQVPVAITATLPADQQKELAARYFATKSTQLFMKLAVTMPTDSRGSGSELIPIYADIDKYGVVPGTGGTVIYIKVKRLESGSTPMVQHSLQFIKNYLPSKAFPGYDVKEESGLRSIIMALAGMRHNLQALTKGEDKVLKNEQKCKWVVTARSFIRLSNPGYFKYGGGHRVKKVILSDNWNKLTAGYDATYGQEYKYTTSEIINGVPTTISSGVASWEPSIGGEENPHRESLRFLNRNTGGPFDYGSVELPIAEMFFPSPSVGYSRVEVLSIHRDTVKNAPGKTVSEYYTTRDFPTRSDYTSLADGSANVQYQPKPILQLLKLDLKKAITVSQGFRVVLNDMNGKMKSHSAYSAFDMVNPISYSQNFYNVNKTTDDLYQFNHSFATLGGADAAVTQNVIGREVEVMTDFREHKTETVSTNVNFNMDLFVMGIFPITIPTWFSPTFYESNTFRSAAMLKVVNHYAILDSVLSVDKGSMVSTKNLVYDAETGNALVTRTANEHNQPQFSFSYPAYWAYTGMGPAYRNIDLTYENLLFRNGILETAVDMSVFESGDELYVISESDKGPMRNLTCDGAGTSLYLPKNPENRIWAVYTGKTSSATPQMVFMDREGKPYTADKVKLRIIRSGKRNLLDQGVGGVTSLADPVRSVSGVNKVVLDDVTGILKTTAASFKDHWRVDNAYLGKDSLIKSVNTVNKAYLSGFADEVLNISKNGSTVSLSPNTSTATVQSQNTGGSGMLVQKVWMKFDLLNTLLNQNIDSRGVDLSYIVTRSHYNQSLIANSGCPPQPDSLLYHGTAHGYNAPNITSSYLPMEGNTTVFQRMKTPWYSYTDATNWSSAFNQSDNLTADNMAFGYSGGNPTSFQWQGDYGYVSSLIKQMIIDRKNGINNPPGFVVQIYKPSSKGENNMRCFWGRIGGYNSCTTPYINISYYPCSNIDSIKNGVAYCSSVSQNYKLCYSKFYTQKSMNPYVEGIWGNWRVDTSFVYYGNLKETDPSVAVDTRKGGVIDNYKPFWNFSANAASLLSRNWLSKDVWVWNSTITQYNRKGYEIENQDALGRYSSGLYGYNQQLPVAVANNSRYREILFDGFEDYSYQSASCTDVCKPRRGWVIPAASTNLDSTQRHTGRYSLKVNAGSTVSFTAPVTTEAEANKQYGMRVRVDSVSYSTTVVTPNGNGIRGKYLTFSSSNNNNSMLSAATTAVAGILSNGSAITRTDGQVNLQQSGGIQPAVNWGKFVVRWDGYIQALESGVHNFRTFSNDGIKVWINNTLLINRWTPGSLLQGDGNISLTKGQTYAIRVEYYDGYSGGQASLLWKYPGTAGYSLVPRSVLYINQTDANGTVATITKWCTKLDSVQVRGNATTDTFSLLQGRDMVLSAWVKEGGTDCKCSTYVKNGITVTFAGSSTTYNFKPSGSIIEGWQRYEAVVKIPATATQITFQLTNTGTADVYYDDLRLHPFNANMKSFVYHGSNMRLLSDLDENNYASFYEYDDDGTLIRVKKETERGIKTITETRSALQKAVQ